MLMRIRKRSIWAAGSRKVLSDSTGFWVAITTKGVGRGRGKGSEERPPVPSPGILSTSPQKVDSKSRRPHNNRIGFDAHNLNPHNTL